MLDLIQPKDIVIDGQTYIISKLPAVAAREILTQYPATAASATLGHFFKNGDYKVNEELTFKLLSYVAVRLENGTAMRLISRALIDTYVKSDYPGETLLKIEDEILGYNCSFFQGGRVSTFLKDIAQKLPALISQMLTASLQRSSQKEKPH
jgi:hypothetical protein